MMEPFVLIAGLRLASTARTRADPERIQRASDRTRPTIAARLAAHRSATDKFYDASMPTDRAAEMLRLRTDTVLQNVEVPFGIDATLRSRRCSAACGSLSRYAGEGCLDA